jgi:hypothetical protein|tara:strand:+ start:2942 stop:4909 length:1968 start_codon:yes stop_codon:yes gene_type:complete
MYQDTNSISYNDPKASLATWIMDRIESWEDHRNTNYMEKWDEYYRIWRGIWSYEDKTRDSEKSHLISPATQQAIEATVAELEEAIFGKEQWFDVRDDVGDQNPVDIAIIRRNLQEDLNKYKVKDGIVEALLNGAIYGTGIAKVNVIEEMSKAPMESQIPDTLTTDVVVTEQEIVKVKIESLTPKEFVIDPCATTIEEALGVAQIVTKPKYEIIEAIKAGIYEDKPIGNYEDMDLGYDDEMGYDNSDDHKVKIVEYWGRVPVKYLDEKNESLSEEFDYDEDELVEAVVVIANDHAVLKATRNPYLMGDRPFVAYQHDRVPNKFWGRGIAEKGYNPQKALDAELRARIDALALTTHPMLGVDATRLPRGVKFEVKAGKTILTNGDPRQTLMPLTFGDISQNTFKEAAELERMVQMGTGAMDTANSNFSNPRNSTASGMSMLQAASIKRQKRTIMNFQENFLIPLVEKAAFRYMQFDSNRYPANDYKFIAYSSMGIMAKELEMTQMIQLLSMTQPGTPPFAMLLLSIFENSSLSNRDQMQQAIAQMMQPDPQAQQVQQVAQQLEIMKLQMEIEEMKASATKDMAHAAKLQSEVVDKQSEEALIERQAALAEKMAKIEKLRIDSANINSETMRNVPEMEHLQSETILNLAKARMANANR